MHHPDCSRGGLRTSGAAKPADLGPALQRTQRPGHGRDRRAHAAIRVRAARHPGGGGSSGGRPRPQGLHALQPEPGLRARVPGGARLRVHPQGRQTGRGRLRAQGARRGLDRFQRAPVRAACWRSLRHPVHRTPGTQQSGSGAGHRFRAFAPGHRSDGHALRTGHVERSHHTAAGRRHTLPRPAAHAAGLPLWCRNGRDRKPGAGPAGLGVCAAADGRGAARARCGVGAFHAAHPRPPRTRGPVAVQQPCRDAG